MRIGIDIDDTTLKTIDSQLKYADKYIKETTGTIPNKNLGNIKSKRYLKELYGFEDEEVFAFCEKYYTQILKDCVPLPNAEKIISKLKNDGNEIHFVTARLMNIQSCDTEKITKESLQKYNIPYDTLNMHVWDKVTFYKEKNFDICIDDSYAICKEAKENGIKAILMTSILNQNINAGDIPKVTNWNEIYEIINIDKN